MGEENGESNLRHMDKTTPVSEREVAESARNRPALGELADPKGVRAGRFSSICSNEYFVLFSPVGVKGNLSLLDIFICFPGVLTKWIF